jgi:hypothetical protein
MLTGLVQYSFLTSYEGQMDSVYWTRRVEWDIDVSEPDDAVVQDESRSISPELDTGNSVLVSNSENLVTGQPDDDGPQVIASPPRDVVITYLTRLPGWIKMSLGVPMTLRDLRTRTDRQRSLSGRRI